MAPLVDQMWLGGCDLSEFCFKRKTKVTASGLCSGPVDQCQIIHIFCTLPLPHLTDEESKIAQASTGQQSAAPHGV